MSIALRASRLLVIMTMALTATVALGQGGQRKPYSGYVYPAGGAQGSNFRVTVGGQHLGTVTGAHITGEGVAVSLIEYVRPLNNKQLRDTAKHVRTLLKQRWAKTRGKPAQAGDRKQQKPEEEQMELLELPDHPWLRGLESKSTEELRNLLLKLFNPKLQPNAQIAEWAVLGVSIAAEAKPGDRELRLITRSGLTNPLRFAVGRLPEVCEEEPNALQDVTEAALELPVVLNGQIMPGDTDAFRLRAEQGQQLVIQARARDLTPYLADTVPGWFQATLAVYDAQGKEVAFADDYRFSPDPVLLWRAPADGEYVLEIKDAIYRGREDFVYRISVAEQPFITNMFPLGGPAGITLTSAVTGWNLPCAGVELDTQPGAERLRQARWNWEAGLSNPRPYMVDTLPEGEETESNDTVTAAQRVAVAQIINGRIGRSGDIDVFEFAGRAGDELVAEVYARRLDSPLDSLLRLTDATGQVLAWNDDYEDKGAGLVTHHADSYLSARLERTGTYAVHLTDAGHHGGEEYGYRLRLSPRRPDFALRLTPSSLSVLAGRATAVTVHALRQDGFDGAIEVLLKDAPAGFALDGGTIPAGRDQVRMTLAAPPNMPAEPASVELEGHAEIDGAIVSRPVIPAEDMMQAFAYWHLVPAEKLMVMGSGLLRSAPRLELASEVPVQIVAGASTEVQLKATTDRALDKLRLEFSEPPSGVTLSKVTQVGNGLTLVLQTDAETAKVGHKDNLIVEVAITLEAKGRDGKIREWQAKLGVLPAIPFEIVKP